MDAENLVRVTPGGPYELQGDFRLLGEETEQRVEHAKLCRCGRSGQLPHCDGSHAQGPAPPPSTDGFESDVEDASGPVEVRFSERGAIHLKGPVRVLDETGALIVKRSRCLLCRCGASRQQPICDGAHNRVG
ncbi:MAG: hypothetical protein ICCCNLDF_01926 [Planctomycetes bacterium]|nr:hypothetical protein [Planctomycetota bacterium]